MLRIKALILVKLRLLKAVPGPHQRPALRAETEMHFIISGSRDRLQEGEQVRLMLLRKVCRQSNRRRDAKDGSQQNRQARTIEAG